MAIGERTVHGAVHLYSRLDGRKGSLKLDRTEILFSRLQLCQICRDNPDLKVLKVDWDENKDIAKPLGVRVRSLPPVVSHLEV